jgi:hypothetical protein
MMPVAPMVKVPPGSVYLYGARATRGTFKQDRAIERLARRKTDAGRSARQVRRVKSRASGDLHPRSYSAQNQVAVNRHAREQVVVGDADQKILTIGKSQRAAAERAAGEDPRAGRVIERERAGSVRHRAGEIHRPSDASEARQIQPREVEGAAKVQGAVIDAQGPAAGPRSIQRQRAIGNTHRAGIAPCAI